MKLEAGSTELKGVWSLKSGDWSGVLPVGERRFFVTLRMTGRVLQKGILEERSVICRRGILNLGVLSLKS